MSPRVKKLTNISSVGKPCQHEDRQRSSYNVTSLLWSTLPWTSTRSSSGSNFSLQLLVQPLQQRDEGVNNTHFASSWSSTPQECNCFIKAPLWVDPCRKDRWQLRKINRHGIQEGTDQISWDRSTCQDDASILTQVELQKQLLKGRGLIMRLIDDEGCRVEAFWTHVTDLSQQDLMCHDKRHQTSVGWSWE